MPVQQERPTILQIAVMFFLVFGIITGIRASGEFKNSSSRLTDINQKLANAKEENLRLKTELEYVQTDEYLEKASVEKLNMTKPGYKIVVLNENTPETIIAKQTQEPYVVKKPNYELWFDALKLN